MFFTRIPRVPFFFYSFYGMKFHFVSIYVRCPRCNAKDTSVTRDCCVSVNFSLSLFLYPSRSHSLPLFVSFACLTVSPTHCLTNCYALPLSLPPVYSFSLKVSISEPEFSKCGDCYELIKLLKIPYSRTGRNVDKMCSCIQSTVGMSICKLGALLTGPINIPNSINCFLYLGI